MPSLLPMTAYYQRTAYRPGTLATAEDRRMASRTRTVYRLARIRTSDDEGLARVRNISDDGIKLSVGMPLLLGDTVSVSLSETLTLEATVVWTNGDECGLKFAQPIDSLEVLKTTSRESGSHDHRAPRLGVAIPAVVTSEKGIRGARVYDISQHGMKIAHDGSFTPGLAVKVSMASGVERRGIVRWVRDDIAGLILTEPFSVQELGSVSAL